MGFFAGPQLRSPLDPTLAVQAVYFTLKRHANDLNLAVAIQICCVRSVHTAESLGLPEQCAVCLEGKHRIVISTRGMRAIARLEHFELSVAVNIHQHRIGASCIVVRLEGPLALK